MLMHRNLNKLILFFTIIIFVLSCTKRTKSSALDCKISKIEICHHIKSKENIHDIGGYLIQITTKIINNSNDTIYLPPIDEFTSIHDSYISAQIGDTIIKLDKIHARGAIIPHSTIRHFLFCNIEDSIIDIDKLIKELQYINLSYQYKQKSKLNMARTIIFYKPKNLKVKILPENSGFSIE